MEKPKDAQSEKPKKEQQRTTEWEPLPGKKRPQRNRHKIEYLIARSERMPAG